MSNEETELIREAMRVLGRRTSEKKRESSRANARRPRPGARKKRARKRKKKRAVENTRIVPSEEKTGE